jgi:hypothetical protein
MGAQLSNANSTGLQLLQSANYTYVRIDSKFSTVFANGSTPDWSSLDSVIDFVKPTGLSPIISVNYVPFWLDLVQQRGSYGSY